MDDDKADGETVSEPVDMEDNSDETSDNSSDIEESEMVAKAENLEAQIKENPYFYDGYKELLTIYKNLGELEQLTNVRKSFSHHFPLTQDLWLDWINDEKALISTSHDKNNLLELFKKAVDDYICVDLWIEYGSYAMGLLDSDKCREIMGEAIQTAGYHTTEGKLLWDLQLEYETALLQSMQPPAGSCPSTEQQNLITAQTKRVDNLYKSLIVTPLVGIQAALGEYEQWLGEGIPSELQEQHAKAVEILDNCSKHERELAEAQGEESRGQAYQSYITSYLAHHSDLTACVRCLFERAIVNNCLNQDLWIKYTTYLEMKREPPSRLISVYKRSVRNCPWSGALWVAYTLCCEKLGDALEVLTGHLETALQSGLLTSQDFLSVWTTYCDVIRRKIDWAHPDQRLLDSLRDTFERAIEHLLKYYGEEGDSECVLPRYWAMIEAKHCNNTDKAREIWNETMTGWRHDKAAAWLEFVSFERQYGDQKHCIKVLQRALKAVTDWPESLCSEYLRFVREEGTLDQLYVAQARVADVRQKIAQDETKRKPKFERRPLNKPKTSQRGKPNKAGDKLPSKNKQNKTSPIKVRQKAVNEDNVGQEGLEASRKTAGTINEEMTNQSSKVNQEPIIYKRKRDQGENKSASNVAASAEFKAPSSGDFKVPQAPAHSKFHTELQSSDQPPLKKTKTDLGSAETSDYSSTDNTTVFVSNLSYTTTEEQLQERFSQCGQVKEVRLMKSRGDKSKGFAYVEFSTIEPVVSALKLDRADVQGRPMYVSPCNQKRSGNTPKLKYETGMEKCKLFVSGLNYDLTKEQVEAEFAKHGKVKDVRIVTYKGGKSKGLAYVEFFNEVDARQALLALDNTQLMDFTIKVAISNPPPRKSTAQSDSHFVPSLGGARKELTLSAPRGRARTQLDLMPRVIRKTPSVPAATASTIQRTQTISAPSSELSDAKSTKTSADRKLSNADFRQMLLSPK
ncbi:squamous cell carcinoma antigen recognized by T-cells 3-like [Watersipora subatra]|uniref:squamous cell carcinoma antigen recognized by T-cells 3-like n=1 Tax=Watersipora subatra TaxID=2589382 RepID=UPI00355B2C7F